MLFVKLLLIIFKLTDLTQIRSFRSTQRLSKTNFYTLLLPYY